ncbi:uncharacterized protein LOC143375375 [Andrena cerasifolii]|uniref:uncharacterized protein LOC143375375 n=1 Tax=Andrena cerasifolii TaxID=2819439 RepID=UPI004037E417
MSKFENGIKVGRAWRASEFKVPPMPDIGLITENVLVPITKMIFTKKTNTTRRNFTERKTELVKPRKSNEDAMMQPLLRQPPRPVENRYMSKLSYSKERKKLGAREKRKISTRPFRLIDKSLTFPVSGHLEKFLQSTRDKKMGEELPFPSPIPNYLEISPTKPESPSVKKAAVNKKTAQQVSCALLNVSKEGDNYENESEDITSVRSLSDSQKNDWFSTDTVTMIYDKDIGFTATNVPNMLTVTKTTTAAQSLAKANSYFGEEGPSNQYCDSILTKIDVTVTETISNTINVVEELKVPARWSESNASNQIEFHAFDISASSTNKFLQTNERVQEAIEDKRSEVRATRGLRYSWEDADHSIPLSLNTNRSRCYDETQPITNEYPCRIKYSWQVVGTSCQTSLTLLESLAKENNPNEESIHDCSIKYSWQIIGTATQTSKRDFTASECRSVISFLSPKTNTGSPSVRNPNSPSPVTISRNGKKFYVLNNQYTQTFAHKESQTNCIEIHVKSRQES